MAGTPRGRLLAIVVLVAVVVVPASAKDYTVGDSSGWKPGVDYTAWAKGKSFAIGDTLSFQYSSSHSVLEVSEADHSACSASNPLRSHRDQSTTVPLTKPGTRYFICGAAGHCASGMKLAITVSGGTDSGSSAGPAMRATNTTPAAGGATTTADAGESDSSAAGTGARLATGLLFAAVGLAVLMMG
ncbi:mavicyanin-like [Miscanthus floridulus]|uniref:mavicyanin-like n=1 Tax=Miscanthus floridulus TaxID=154761 RepID=UPI0034590EFE